METVCMCSCAQRAGVYLLTKSNKMLCMWYTELIKRNSFTEHRTAHMYLEWTDIPVS